MLLVSVPGNAPPAQVSASITLAPAGSVATPGCLTRPATSTTTRALDVGDTMTVGDGCAAGGPVGCDELDDADTGERAAVGAIVTGRARPCQTARAVPATANSATSATASAAAGDTASRPSRS